MKVVGVQRTVKRHMGQDSANTVEESQERDEEVTSLATGHKASPSETVPELPPPAEA